MDGWTTHCTLWVDKNREKLVREHNPLDYWLRRGERCGFMRREKDVLGIWQRMESNKSESNRVKSHCENQAAHLKGKLQGRY